PDEGKLLLGQERMLLFRQEAFASLRELLHVKLGTRLARAAFMQFGYQCGQGDYEALSAMYAWESDVDRLGAGPRMHAWEGLVKVEPLELEVDRAAGRLFFRGLWKNSYEAEVHVQRLGPASEPVCYSLTGYASGWTTALLGVPTLAIERECTGCGAPHCTWEVREEGAWGPEADPWREALRSTETLAEKLAIIESQRQAIAELSSPIIQVWDEIVALPVVGRIDDRQAASVTTRMLDAVTSLRARYALIDLTGVDGIDTGSANHLLNMIRALGLLGCTCYLCGISPSIAQTVVAAGIDLQGVPTFATLHKALAAALTELGMHVQRR
ncbi:MAG TPA: XylR N-terminal domain-containing protein, partial [Nannocystis sp.]